MIITLVTIAVASAFILGEVENFTKKPIADAQKANELAAIAAVVSDFDNNPFAEKMIITTSDKKHKLEFFPARKDGIINSFAVKTYSNAGFGGRIEMIVGFYIDGAIKNYVVTSNHETPGLGSKINDHNFKQQFDGFNPQKKILKVRQDGGDVDAVTAATISSRAVLDAIKKAYDSYHNLNSGEKHE
mgnify:CR=1 FL=1